MPWQCWQSPTILRGVEEQFEKEHFFDFDFNLDLDLDLDLPDFEFCAITSSFISSVIAQSVESVGGSFSLRLVTCINKFGLMESDCGVIL